MVDRPNRKTVSLSVALTDMGTASTKRVFSPVEGRLLEVQAVLNEAIGDDGGDPAADADVTVTFGLAGAAISGLSLVFPTSGSAAGQCQHDSPAAETVVRRGQALSATCDAGGAVTGAAKFTFVIEQV